MDDITRLAALFDEAISLPEAGRKDFVAQVTVDDSRLGEELRTLLDSHGSATGYFDDLSRSIVTPGYRAVLGEGKQEVLLPQLQAHLAGRFNVLEEIGGGMSRVFLAEEVRLGRKIVLKVLPPQMAGASVERFQREIQVAAQLQHPHIVPLLASDSAGPFLYYTMPLIAGESLRDRLAREGALPVRHAIRIWKDVLEALAHAHANGVIHRDIKPANILLGATDALVSDFGIARAIEAAGGDATATAPGLVIGTPAYMAPEQVVGDDNTDHRIDIYAAGLVMHEMLDGRPPFTSGSPRDVALARLSQVPARVSRPDCPGELAELVSRCLEREPAARPQTAASVLEKLDSVSLLPRNRSRAMIAGYAAAAVALVAFAFGAQRFADPPEKVVSAAASPAPSAPSIAVLPLANLSAASEDEALANGMTEELTSVISRAGNLRVISSTSVSALASRAMDVRQIAESLQVSHVLEGGVQKVGTRLRLQTRLVDARDGTTLWSETYDREMGDIFTVQDEIAQAVSRELKVRLAKEPARGTRRYTPSVEAYEWYLRGNDPSMRRTARDRERAVAYLRKAVEADSNFAAAYAAQVRLILSDGRPGSTWITKLAEQVGRKAVALDDSLAAAHSGLGWALLYPGRWHEAAREFRRAIELDQRDAVAYEGFARVLLYTGPPSEQLAMARAAVNVDPFSHSTLRELALALSMNGRCDEAIERMRPLKQLTPPAGVAGVIIGQCYAAKQMWPQAIAEFRWAMENTDARTALGLLGYSLARSGKRKEAEAILADLISKRKDSHRSFGIAVVHTGLGNFNEAFVALEKSAAEGTIRVYLMGPMFDDLRRDARFGRIRQLMGV